MYLPTLKQQKSRGAQCPAIDTIIDAKEATSHAVTDFKAHIQLNITDGAAQSPGKVYYPPYQQQPYHDDVSDIAILLARRDLLTAGLTQFNDKPDN